MGLPCAYDEPDESLEDENNGIVDDPDIVGDVEDEDDPVEGEEKEEFEAAHLVGVVEIGLDHT